MNSYELSRNFVDWAFENPDKIKPIHYAIYFFSIEHCNRLGWKDKFGLPSQMVMEAIGVKNWRTYSSGLNELVDFGFIKMIETSRNQYSSNIVAIVKNTKASTKASTKALDKALQQHVQKQGAKQSQSTVSIDKQLNNLTNNNLTNKQKYANDTELDFSMFDNSLIEILWKDWKEYKWNQHKEKFKAVITEQVAINKLAELSNNRSDNAKKIIEQSISNLWKGLFELKINNQNQNNGNNGKTQFTSQPKTMDERLAERIERANQRDLQQMHSPRSDSQEFSNYETI
jgi:hypothetical protein